MLSRPSGVLATVAVLLCAAAVGCDDSPVERTVDLVVPVTVQPVAVDTVEATVEATGSLRAAIEAELIAEIRGNLFYERLAAGRPADGTRVAADERVARLESSEFEVGLRLESKRLALENARVELHEQEALVEQGLAVASDAARARKAVLDAETDLQDSEIQLEKMHIVAPISGFLAELTDTSESTLVQQNAVIGKIVDYTNVILDLNIPNSAMGSVRVGLAVRVSNFALGERTFDGRVITIDPTIDPTTRTSRVEASLPNTDLALRPGMFVKAEIITERRSGVLVIPRELMLTRQNRDVVFVEVDGRAELREIETGLEEEGRVEVLSGLEAGDRLITSNYETLRSRTPVRVTGESAPGT